ncbi:MAG: [FeFe] hydrogenase H-cluster radical SAM maturase HydE [Ruminococcaceae bacterium]|nr:[FeFe] hydrogenase H-cluster radical SAM maturase HydE [Oscillospiraceae bacterium]
MNERVKKLIDALYNGKNLTLSEYEYLVSECNEENAAYAAALAVEKRKAVYGNKIFIRGLIEISSFCKNDCYYCGIRKSNKNCERYRLTREEILDCCDAGYELGFRTFVMQGGEDAFFTDDFLCEIISEIKRRYPDCAVTLSLGERSRDSYERLYNAGANRYLLRHETADETHYGKLHPPKLTLKNRMKCLYDLKEIGFQVGCGFMVGSPYQTYKTIASDLKFIEQFKPDMCGIGPFIPHKDTDFRNEKAGSLLLTCYLLSLVRLIYPNVLLPSTTALGTIDPMGREKGVLSGANVVMPNLSPMNVRKKYALYDNKISTGEEAAECKAALEKKMNAIGYKIVTERGDIKL